MSLPDTTVAAWTGSPQSFLDDSSSSPYMCSDEPISRSNVLRHRHNFRLQDESSRPLSWRPFGYVWWIKTTKGLVQDVQLGFRNDTGRFIPNVPDHLGTLHGHGRIAASEVIRLEASRDSTVRMLNFCNTPLSLLSRFSCYGST
ncbi:hypothetical protein B0T26DRAFT_736122 [Lasiosphaeria miniovina]|uniref:Uncharacterized protein n=1 Tax=Lasiosphaeria miniovina TaxID=1954250 RepID=A0AA40BF01_9PEZI|nr:uncharacterized protein B0T26DRAFT_736122 [Lasiosphaeria miniovina]KAK0733051.1 hypothetical protein B0T26DRAFT_736122 [Lasiosphaeria miniovina]